VWELKSLLKPERKHLTTALFGRREVLLEDSVLGLLK
jgi:hypothetical protein